VIRWKTKAVAAAALLLLGVGGMAAGEKGPQPAQPSWRVPLGDVGRGAALAAPCLGCHGAEPAAAEGLPQVPPKIHRQRQSYLFLAMREYREGVRKNEIMEPFAEGLSDQDMRDLAAYFAQGFPDRPPEAKTALPGYAVTNRECGLCHGETGVGELEGMPVLTGQDPAYLAHALRAYRSGERSDPTMRRVAQAIPPDQDEAVAAFYGTHVWLEHGK
jgi:cytochrome c553